MALPKAKVLDVSDSPDLRRMVDEARVSGEPYVLRIGDRAVALLTPLADTDQVDQPVRRPKTEADREAFRSAFGGWKGLVDGEELKRRVYASRGSNRPPVDL